MNKKKILAELVGYLVRKEFTVYEVLDAYYEESERHFFEDELPENIPSEEQKNPYELEPLPCSFEGQRELTQDEINQAVADVNRIFENKALQINAEKEPAETLETLETEPETKETEPDFVIPPEMTLKEYRQTQGYFSYALAKHYTVNGKTIEQYLNENNITVDLLKHRLASKCWPFIKALTQKPRGFNSNNYGKVMPNGLTVSQNLKKNGITAKQYSCRIFHGEEEYSACTRPLRKFNYKRKKSKVADTVVLPETDVYLDELNKKYDGYFYGKFKDFILNGKTIDEHLKKNNVSPDRFYDRMKYKGWSIQRAALTKIEPNFNYDMITDNGKTIRENLVITGIAQSTFLYRLKKGFTIYEACTTSEYDMRSKQTTKGVRAWKKNLEEKLKAENELQEPEITEPELNGAVADTVIIDTVPAEESPEPKQEPKKKRGSKKEPKKEPKREYTLDDDPPAKNVVASNVPDLTLVDLCQNMKISMKRLKDRIDKGTFPKPDKGNKWSYAAVRFYFPN